MGRTSTNSPRREWMLTPVGWRAAKSSASAMVEKSPGRVARSGAVGVGVKGDGPIETLRTDPDSRPYDTRGRPSSLSTMPHDLIVVSGGSPKRRIFERRIFERRTWRNGAENHERTIDAGSARAPATTGAP